MTGLEAHICLQYLMERGGAFEDPTVDYLAERVDEMDAAALLEAMALIRKRLSGMEVLEGTDTGERIFVTKDYRILLPDRFDAEIRLRPLLKMLFLLFLRHPEGIRFGELGGYKAEMMDLYQGISSRTDREGMERSIDRIIDPKDNSIHEKASNLAAALARYFPAEKLPAYSISGKAGSPKRIRLDRSLVEWE